MRLPLLLFLLVNLLGAIMAQGQFGRHLLEQFSFDPAYINLNHGSFGATPKSVQSAQVQRTNQMEAMPDPWFRQDYRDLVDQTRHVVAAYLNVTNQNDLTLVENASAGVNAVFRAMRFKAGDKVLLTSTAYSMVKNLVKYYQERDGIELVEVPLVFPMTSWDDILLPVANAIREHGSSIKLASFSHIDSVPGVILPVNELIKLCRNAGIRVLIDGAHAVGQIPVDIATMDPDYYVTNGHKWLYSPKGTALFYVRKELQADIEPTVISSEWQQGAYLGNFRYTGTRDYTGFTAIQSALDFRASVGGDAAIMAYLHDLAWWAGNYLATKWGTSLLLPEMMVGSMIDVRLPVETFAEAQALREYIFEEYTTYFIVHEQNSKPYTRLSAQIYLEQADFILFGDRLLEAAGRLRADLPDVKK